MIHQLCRLLGHQPVRQPTPTQPRSVPCRCGRYYWFAEILTLKPWPPGADIDYRIVREKLKPPHSVR